LPTKSVLSFVPQGLTPSVHLQMDEQSISSYRKQIGMIDKMLLN